MAIWELSYHRGRLDMNRYAVGGRWRRRGAASVSRLAVPLHTYGALNLNTAASYASAKAHVARVCINASETWWIVVRTSVLSSLPHVQHPYPPLINDQA